MDAQKYLLDTCTVLYFLKANTKVMGYLKNVNPSELCISAITVLEIECGFSLDNSNRLDVLRQKWQEFLQLVRVLEFGQNTAFIASNIKSYLKQQGQMIGAYDILIAATALEQNLICVTNNSSEFSRVHNIKIQDWAK